MELIYLWILIFVLIATWYALVSQIDKRCSCDMMCNTIDEKINVLSRRVSALSKPAEPKKPKKNEDAS